MPAGQKPFSQTSVMRFFCENTSSRSTFLQKSPFITCSRKGLKYNSNLYSKFGAGDAMLYPFQPSTAFHIETNYLICTTN